jgi:hypothetical protein
VPAGTPIRSGDSSHEDRVHELTFELDEAHLAGRATKPIHLPGFGEANVRFEIS